MKRDLRCLPYWRGTVQGHTRYRSIHREVLTLLGGLVGPLDKRKARRLRSPEIAQYRKGLFVGHGLESQQSMPPNLICGVTKVSIRINLDLEPEYEAFVKEWADKLGISLSELMRRVVHETCNGYRYDEKIPDYYPLERRPDWKRLDRRRDRRKRRAAARLT